MAGLCIASSHHRQITFTRSATVRRRLQHNPLPQLLAAAAGSGATAPERPVLQQAVLCIRFPTSRGSCLAKDRVAVRDLLQAFLAGRAIAPSKGHDGAQALADAPALAAAQRPLRPQGQAAVRVLLAKRQTAAQGELLTRTFRHGATGVGQHGHSPAPHLEGVAALRGASAPGGPVTPLSIQAFAAAGLIMTRGHLLLVLCLAGLAAVSRRLLHRTAPPLGASSASSGTGAPLNPPAPGAVHHLCCRDHARLQLHSGAVAGLAVSGGPGQLALAARKARPRLLGAHTPGFPV
mmetsp:Transcript_54314/g.129783  ORF Transcript_54314/g.129783 Transcript_54314/m.129783 type:complete len:292 (-) Transcript_54314:1811-2686(-)